MLEILILGSCYCFREKCIFQNIRKEYLERIEKPKKDISRLLILCE